MDAFAAALQCVCPLGAAALHHCHDPHAVSLRHICFNCLRGYFAAPNGPTCCPGARCCPRGSPLCGLACGEPANSGGPALQDQVPPPEWQQPQRRWRQRRQQRAAAPSRSQSHRRIVPTSTSNSSETMWMRWLPTAATGSRLPTPTPLPSFTKSMWLHNRRRTSCERHAMKTAAQ
jgi:hypothetical protein